MSPTLRRHVLPLCAAFGWLWMLLPFHTLGIDALILALLQAALLFSLKRKEQFFIPMLAYPIKLRPMILSDCLRDAGWWIVLTLPLLIPHAGVQLQILSCSAWRLPDLSACCSNSSSFRMAIWERRQPG